MGHKDPDRRREYQREYTRDGRHLMKKLQRCIQCGEQDAFTLAGRARCAECAEKARIYNRERAAKHQAEINARNRRYAEDRKAAGLCVKCGRPSDGHSSCPICRAKNAERARKARGGDLRGVGGLCKMCGRYEAIPGEKLCERCYTACCANLVKARAAQDNSSHPWRLDEKMRFAEVLT